MYFLGDPKVVELLCLHCFEGKASDVEWFFSKYGVRTLVVLGLSHFFPVKPIGFEVIWLAQLSISW